MEAVTTLPRGEPLTRDDLQQTPDDGHRYELVEGSLVVTPARSYRHQDVVLNLAVVLKSACPSELKVLVAPFDVVLSEHSVLQPDLLVARRADFTDRELPTAPLLAVEVLSPSTRLIDTELKHARYQAAGSPSYWVIDPDALELTTWELRHGEYVEAVHATGDTPFTAATPFPVTFSPSQLLD